MTAMNGDNLSGCLLGAIVKKTQNEARREIVMRKKAIGIDLGTTNSVMAVVREDMQRLFRWGRMTIRSSFSGLFLKYWWTKPCVFW